MKSILKHFLPLIIGLFFIITIIIVLLWSDTDIEHGPSEKLTTPGVYSATIRITLAELQATEEDYLYFRFGANGNKDDDWYIKYKALELYLTAENEAVVKDDDWSEINPLD